MQTLIEDIKWLYFAPAVYEMANMPPDTTGLKYVIHIMNKGGAKHSARVKVSNVSDRYAHDDNFTLTAEDDPRVIGKCKIKKEHLDDIIDWVKLNRHHIHKIWNDNGMIDPQEMIDGFNHLK